MNIRLIFGREYLKPGEGHVEDVLFNAHVRLLSLLGYAWNHPHLKLILVANVWTRRRFAGSSSSSTSTDASSSSTDAVPPGKRKSFACCHHVFRHPCTVVYPTEALSLLDDEDAVVGRAMMLAALMLRWRLLDGQSLVLRDADGGPLRYGLFLTFPFLSVYPARPLAHNQFEHTWRYAELAVSSDTVREVNLLTRLACLVPLEQEVPALQAL
jgi:hypothetical protein